MRREAGRQGDLACSEVVGLCVEEVDEFLTMSEEGARKDCPVDGDSVRAGKFYGRCYAVAWGHGDEFQVESRVSSVEGGSGISWDLDTDLRSCSIVRS